MPAMTRGPLPARVYWVRRLLVLITAVLLVFGIARLLGGGSDGKSGGSGTDGSAQLAADGSASTAPSSSAVTPSRTLPGTVDPTTSGRPSKGKHSQSASPTLPAPDGTCADEDVAVTPEVPDPVAGRDVRIVLSLRTLQSDACTWRISRNSLTVKITSGSDDIWSSAECPRAIPVRDVVVRRATTTSVAMIWKEARRSDDTCSPRTDWAMPGWYHVTASSLAGEPSDVQFKLATPTSATVTKTAKPKQSPTGSTKPD